LDKIISIDNNKNSKSTNVRISFKNIEYLPFDNYDFKGYQELKLNYDWC